MYGSPRYGAGRSGGRQSASTRAPRAHRSRGLDRGTCQDGAAGLTPVPGDVDVCNHQSPPSQSMLT